MINRPKGTLDVLPADSFKWHKIENCARETARLFGLKEIRTPVFEHTELFLRGVGDTTDIVNKEMYTFEDKGGRSITLKPEGTAGVARAYIENGIANEPQPVKMYYFTPVFRYERPQAGRLREHHQFGVELYGAESFGIDAEAIMTARHFLNALGLRDITLEINSIGCPNCRKKYNAALREYAAASLDKMCQPCAVRYDKNPLRLLDCKVAACKEIMRDAPAITDYLCQPCAAHFDGVKSLLDAFGAEYRVNPRIVRGLDYYNRTVFEFTAKSERAQGTVCGGGRYDGLVADVGGAATPAVGFGLGLERLLILMEEQGIELVSDEVPDVFIVCADGAALLPCAKLVNSLRSQGLAADTDHLGRSVKAQFKFAGKGGARFAAVIGGSELESGEITLKRMSDGQEFKIGIDNVKGIVDIVIKP